MRKSRELSEGSPGFKRLLKYHKEKQKRGGKLSPLGEKFKASSYNDYPLINWWVDTVSRSPLKKLVLLKEARLSLGQMRDNVTDE